MTATKRRRGSSFIGRHIAVFFIGFISLRGAVAQTNPDYMLAMGAGYTRNNGLPNVTESWMSAFVGLGGGVYSKTTIDMTAINTVRTGFCKVFTTQGNWMVGSCVDAGVQNVTPVIGSFSGGAFVAYDLKRLRPWLEGVKALAEVRITGATATAAPTPGATNLVVPGFYVGFGKTF